MAKNLNGISMELIEDKTLLRLNMHISATKYLEKRVFCFTKVTENDKERIEDGKEIETVSNSEEKTK